MPLTRYVPREEMNTLIVSRRNTLFRMIVFSCLYILRPVAVSALMPETHMQDSVQITNLMNNETLTYPVALLRGTVDNEATEIIVVNDDNPVKSNQARVPVVNNHFVAVVELIPGSNHLSITGGNATTHLALNYQPAKSEHYVNVVYLTADDGNTRYLTQFANDPQDYRQKLDMALKLMQTLTAERLNDIGLGRKTFTLKFDQRGKVIVHTLRYPQNATTLQAMDGNQLYQLFIGGLLHSFRQNMRKMSSLWHSPAMIRLRSYHTHTLHLEHLEWHSSRRMECAPGRVTFRKSNALFRILLQ